MAESANYNELAHRYGLAPIPDSVFRLTQLVASQDANLDEIARVISAEPELRGRLLRLANPGALTKADYVIETVEEALFRRGIGAALLLAMNTPLAFALAKTLQTMLALKLEARDPDAAPPLLGEYVLGTIGFAGKAVGSVGLRMSVPAATRIAAGIIGLEPKELTDPSEINDAIGELLNIITGNFKSNLCDAGLDCRLFPPKVKHTAETYKPVIPGGSLERMAFRADAFYLFIDMVVNPWGEE